MSRATSLVAVGQQVSISTGVAIGALAVELTVRARGHAEITAADFQPAASPSARSPPARHCVRAMPPMPERSWRGTPARPGPTREPTRS